MNPNPNPNPTPNPNPKPKLRALLPAFACLALLLVSGCVSDGAPPQPVTEDERMSAEPASVRDLSRVLVELDRRVDKYVYWKSQPGAEAEAERRLERSAAASLVRLQQDALIRTARDASDPTRRGIAAKSLAFATDSRAIDALVDCLSETGQPRLLAYATFALSELKSPQTPAVPLIDLITHPDGSVRNNTLLALFHSMEARRRLGQEPLGPIERAEALPLIEAVLYDMEDAFVRGHAAACLGSIGDPRSVDPLINLLPDPEPFVRVRTAVALSKLGDTKAIPALVEVIDESPRGTPRDAVTTALRILLERAGRSVPDIADTERAWRSFLRERPVGGTAPDR